MEFHGSGVKPTGISSLAFCFQAVFEPDVAGESSGAYRSGWKLARNFRDCGQGIGIVSMGRMATRFDRDKMQTSGLPREGGSYGLQSPSP